MSVCFQPTHAAVITALVAAYARFMYFGIISGELAEEQETSTIH